MRKRLGVRRLACAVVLTVGSVLVTWVSPPSASAAPATDTATNSTDATVDGGSTNPGLVIDTAMTVTEVEIAIDFSKIDNNSPGTCGPPPVNGPGNVANGETYFTLISPVGTIVSLAVPGTWSGQDFPGAVTVTFDDDAASAPNSTPTTGTFRPAQPLSAFEGQNAEGTWVLVVGDNAGGDPVCFYEARLTVNGETGPPALAPVCVKVGLDWRAPYADGTCPSGFTGWQIQTANEGLPVCTKVKLDWRNPDRAGCPAGYTLHHTVATGGLPVCTKPDTDWRAPYANGSCPSGFTRHEVATTGVPTPF